MGRGGCLGFVCVWGSSSRRWHKVPPPVGHFAWPNKRGAQAAGAGTNSTPPVGDTLAKATAAAASPSACLPARFSQKCHLQCGVPLEQSGRLAAHTADKCKKYAASNSSYEADAAGAPIKLVSGAVLRAAAGSPADSACSCKALARGCPKLLRHCSNLSQTCVTN
jgi:hypothetical protein